MPRHLFEGNPVDEGTKRRGTATLMHRSENPADTTDSSTSGLSPREPLERQAEFHSSTHKEDCLSCPNSAGTLRYKSEMESYTEIPASTRDEAFFHCTKPSGVPRGPANSTVSLTSQRHAGKFPKVTGRSRGKRGFPSATRERPLESFFNAS